MNDGITGGEKQWRKPPAGNSVYSKFLAMHPGPLWMKNAVTVNISFGLHDNNFRKY